MLGIRKQQLTLPNFLKVKRRTGAFPRRGEFTRYNKKVKENDTCHKSGKLGNYIIDCPLYKVEYKEYVKKVVGSGYLLRLL